jgi:predicted transcriptional regulator
MCSRVQDVKARKRDKMGIISDILDVAKGPVLKTQIMYKANLSYTQLNEYLAFLLTTNMITQTFVNEKEIYQITPNGINFLRKHGELIYLFKTMKLSE